MPTNAALRFVDTTQTSPIDINFSTVLAADGSFALSLPRVIMSGPLALKGPLYDVKAYGATGDGVTNDQAAIQAAITAAVAAGGGVVLFPPGVYIVNTSLSIKDNIVLQGAGREATTIKGASSIANAVILGSSGDTVSNATVCDLTVDGNAGVTTGNLRGIQVTSGSRLTIAGVRVFNTRDSGINLTTCPDS